MGQTRAELSRGGRARGKVAGRRGIGGKGDEETEGDTPRSVGVGTTGGEANKSRPEEEAAGLRGRREEEGEERRGPSPASSEEKRRPKQQKGTPKESDNNKA